MIRLFLDEPLAPGTCLTPPKGPAHYLLTVMRAKEGDTLLVFNGRDGEWRARIAAAGRKSATLALLGQSRPQTAEAGPWLAFAPVKRAKTDLIVEKATELGVSRLIPVATARTVAARIKSERLNAIAVEAAEQCGRLTVPGIAAMTPLDELLADWPRARALIFCDEARTGPPLLPTAAAGEAGVLIGPEGGFSEAERTQIAAHPAARPVSLGPRILRAETAAIVALALVNAAQGGNGGGLH